MSATSGPRWHEALAYAVLGRRVPIDPSAHSHRGPDLATLTAQLRDLGLPAPGTPPYAVPADLRRGLGPAQFAAALRRLRAELGLDATPASPVTTARPLTAEEARLVADRPPHHATRDPG